MAYRRRRTTTRRRRRTGRRLRMLEVARPRTAGAVGPTYKQLKRVAAAVNTLELGKRARSVGMRSRAERMMHPGGGSSSTTQVRPGPFRAGFRAGKRRRIMAPAQTRGDLIEGGTYKVRIGRGRPLPRQLYKISPCRTLRVQAMKPYDRTNDSTLPGKVPLHFATYATDGTILPGFIMGLTHTCNVSQATAAYYPYLSNVGTVGFDRYSTVFTKEDGTTATEYWAQDSQRVGRPDTTLVDMSNCPINERFIKLNWVDIRLNLYGATNQPTKYLVQIVQFSEDWLDPLESPGTGPEFNDRNAFWQYLFQPLICNPIQPRPQRKGKGMRVLFSKTVIIQPGLTIEKDVNPPNVTMHIFARDGNSYDYAYTRTQLAGAGADDNLAAGAWAPQSAPTLQQYYNYPMPKARKYLFIRALNTTKVEIASETNLNTPSFDIVVRKSESYNY